MKFTRDRYQHGSLRRVPRAKGPDVWEFRYSTYEDGVRKQKQLTLSSKKYPTEAPVKRKVEGLLLKINADSSGSAIQDPTLEAVMEVFTPEEMPERLKSQAWLKKLDYCPETKPHIKSMLYRLFECAMTRGWIEAQRNPMSLVRVKGRNRVVEKVVLTPEQMATVRENPRDPILLMSELACYLGLRICEVLGLMWEDFDPKAKTLSICRSAVDGNVADVKTEASRDVIPLSGKFIAFILRWQKVAPPSAGGWMFPSVVTGRPCHAGILLRRHFAPLASKVGIPRLGWHTFRHAFRSWLDAVGTAVGVQQKMMRHAVSQQR